jgi:hypothetical protein
MKYLLLFFALAFAGAGYAQETAVAKKNPISVQVLAGTQGVGAEVRYGLQPKLGIRLGGSTSTSIKVNDAIKFSGFEAGNTISAEISNIHLLADYAPFHTNAFRLVAGAGYLFQAGGGLQFVPIAGKNYTFGEVTLTGEEVGQIDVDLSWKGLAPYLGLGLFKALPKGRFNVNLDLGTYFLKSPNSTVTGTKMLADNQEMELQLEKNMKDYRFLPVLQLNFNFRIR